MFHVPAHKNVAAPAAQIINNALTAPVRNAGMKLGSQTGSVMNHLFSRATIGQPKPVVGMGCTMLLWSDRSAGTITKVTEIGGSKRWLYEIEVCRDVVTVVAGSSFDGSAEYVYRPSTVSHRYIFRMEREGGAWREVYKNLESGKMNLIAGGGKGLRIGERDEYRDPSF